MRRQEVRFNVREARLQFISTYNPLKFMSGKFDARGQRDFATDAFGPFRLFAPTLMQGKGDDGAAVVPLQVHESAHRDRRPPPRIILIWLKIS